VTDPIPEAEADATVFHLVSQPVWERYGNASMYVPESYDQDGFIHCTKGEANLIAVGNAFYKEDQRPFLALKIDLQRVAAPVRYDDESQIYPHIYGPLPADAVIGVSRVVRSADGSFDQLVGCE
jgi:uncharacterized protein (DUF952 family)